MKAIASKATTREEQLRRALFRGGDLGLHNPGYVRAMEAILGELLASDVGAGDLTVAALGLEDGPARGRVIAKEAGVVAGLSEFGWLYGRGGIGVEARKNDGDEIRAGETLLEIEGRRGALLEYERVGLNLLQRMSGIATATRRWRERAGRAGGAQVVATRKTPWGPLDKRAVYLGGGGTHRLGLWDAVLVKNNHLALVAEREEDAVAIAARRIWTRRADAAFLEVEVRSRASAVTAARAFAELRAEDPEACPCLLLLDNMDPAEVRAIAEALEAAGLADAVLLEASGNITEENLEAYASSGADALSAGALTHSSRALDISQRIAERGKEPR